MNKSKHKTIKKRLQENWKSGLTVSLVSIPLSVSLAVASGATPTMGIITALWAGFAAAFFGGSDYNVVGPTGALSGLLAVFAIQYGAESLPMLAIVTGIFVLAAWKLKLERFIKHIPEHTIQGFTVGVAITIAATQLGGALGIKLPDEVKEQFDKIVYFLTHLSDTAISTFFVFALFLSLLFVFKKLTPKFPGAITLSPFGILLGYLATAQKLPFSLATLGSKFPDISAKLFIAPHIYFDYSLIVPAIGVALIAIIETGISAKIADGVTGTKHNEQKEIFGLSIANIVSGLAGGIPATAALARTSLNMKSGANHKTSGMLNALSILIISFIFLKYFVYIPMAVIASILVFTAYQLIEKEPLKHMWVHNKFDFAITSIVAFICIYKDTIYGISFGLLIYLATYLNKKYKFIQ